MRGSPGRQYFSVLAAILIVACEPSGKRKPVDVADFDSDSAMTDTLHRLVPAGTPLATARSVMEQSGFQCDVRSDAFRVDTAKAALQAMPPDLVCFASKRFFPWFQHRDWTVRYRYDTAGVRDVVAGHIIQP